MSKALIAALAFFIGLVNATNWAVIISGSEEMYNYRHHADVGHAFDLLTAGKIAPENIITMVYNDVPTHRSNPRSGEMFNKPSSDYDGNVWTQVLNHVDYAGEDVNVENFINVLLGNSPDGCKVLKSTEDDNVFIFYSDHGTDGLLSMPGSNSPLLVDDLRKTLLNMSFSKKFKNLVFYLEACYSGSMFQGWLEHDTPHNIWAVTAANARESSWGWYCPPNSSVGSTRFNTCLGDEFSVAWMESVDEGSDTMTLKQHFEYLRDRVSKSHVTLYGNPKMANLKVSDFVNAPGAVRKPKISFDDAMMKHQMVTVEEMNHKIQDALAIDSRDMKLAYHYSQYTAAKEGTFQEKYDSGIRLINEIKQRLADDAFFSKLASDYFGPSNASSVLLSSPVEASAYECGSCCTDAYKAFYSGSCKGFNDYSLKYGHIFKSICMDKSLRTRNINVENLSAHLSSNIEKTCSMPPVQF